MTVLRHTALRRAVGVRGRRNSPPSDVPPPGADSDHAKCRGVIITDSVTSPFTTIYIVYSSTHSLGGHGDKQKKVLKSTFSSTDSDRIWHTPRRDRDASNLIFWHVGNSPNSKKVDFSPKFRKFISRKRAEIFSLDFRDL